MSKPSDPTRRISAREVQIEMEVVHTPALPLFFSRGEANPDRFWKVCRSTQRSSPPKTSNPFCPDACGWRDRAETVAGRRGVWCGFHRYGWYGEEGMHNEDRYGSIGSAVVS